MQRQLVEVFHCELTSIMLQAGAKSEAVTFQDMLELVLIVKMRVQRIPPEISRELDHPSHIPLRFAGLLEQHCHEDSSEHQ